MPYIMKPKLVLLLVVLSINTFYISAQKDTKRSYIDLARESFRKAQNFESKDPDSATIYRSHLKEALGYYEKAGTTENHLHYNLLIGRSFFDANNLDSALVYLRRSIDPYDEDADMPEDELRLDAIKHIAHIYRAKGDHKNAARYGRKVLHLVGSMADSLEFARYSQILAKTYRDMGYTFEAAQFYKTAGELAAFKESYELAASCYGSAASCYIDVSNSREALAMVGNAIKYGKLSNDKNLLGRIMLVAGSAQYSLIEDYEAAVAAYDEAIKYFEEAGSDENYRHAQLVKASVLKEMGESRKAMEVVGSVGEKNLEPEADTLARPGSYDDLKRQLQLSNLAASDRQLRYELTNFELAEREARSLRQRIWFVSALAGLIIMVLLLLYNRQRQKAKAEAAARYAQEKENKYTSLLQETELRMMRKYIDGLESERGRISKELHDGVCNDLLALEMDLRSNGAETVKQAALLQSARENIRGISHELMPPAFQYASIDEILSDYIGNFKLPENVVIRYDRSADMDWDSVPQAMAFEVYRVTQEAVGNSMKHSGAGEIDVLLTAVRGTLTLEVRDNGTGFDKTGRSRGAGLNIIRERVESIGGTLHIETSEDGTALRATFRL